MRLALSAVLACSVSLLGCGQHCDSAIDHANYVSSCTRAGSNAGYCNCSADYLFARYACDNFSSVTQTDATAACRECAPPNGEVCSE